jgi:hypothetical protein
VNKWFLFIQKKINIAISTTYPKKQQLNLVSRNFMVFIDVSSFVDRNMYIWSSASFLLKEI